MDQTGLFGAMVKTVRLRNKAHQRESGVSLDSSLLLTRPSRKPTPFASQARDVATCITKLQQFLLQHRKEYIDSVGHLGSSRSSMTDTDRDRIDTEAQEFIKLCSDRIRSLEETVADDSIGDQARLYRKSVYESLGEYLKRVCKLYSEQRAVRVKRIVDRKRVSRLQPDGYKRKMAAASSSPKREEGSPAPVEGGMTGGGGEGGRVVEEGGVGGGREGGGVVEEEKDESQEVDAAQPPLPPLSSRVGGAEFTEEKLTEEERRTFEVENEQLFENMSSMVDEVRKIEGKILEISKLQEVFAEKVLDQAKQLDIINEHAVEASENVREGNEQVRGAIKNKASLRLWILFILIVCSFALLFLDWYS